MMGRLQGWSKKIEAIFKLALKVLITSAAVDTEFIYYFFRENKDW